MNIHAVNQNERIIRIVEGVINKYDGAVRGRDKRTGKFWRKSDPYD